MIAIIDSGSTKTDWRILDKNGKECFSTRTIGLNPYFLTAENILLEIQKNEGLVRFAPEISHSFFYGAGCSATHYKNRVKEALDEIFSSSKNVVEHDLLAAAYACYEDKPIITCILGTGSNSCFFDGKEVREETPSLAYILGDEGSGSYIGKRVLRYYFLNKMPKNIAEVFRYQFSLTINQVNKNVYNNPYANAYLASFNRFVVEHKHEPFFQRIIYDSLKDFIINQILVYPEARYVDLNFIGSIAHFYEDMLAVVTSEFQLKIGKIIQKPIENLVNYHIKHILPHLK